ncbi:hypothetical protein LWC34_38840 [Kibdelosporangium philippinense]|uniref:HK97 gp10 family phage protein n=1 Tax=Kibdelosporangium philippinense TaxID=211113 RepID=A0ABS8ZSC6_9PSEU|nr:hypothetical protein [Kibdelosporangium philippinense]MCE7008727.1 hypothetical protein [Kibdelosporangium philippinense]
MDIEPIKISGLNEFNRNLRQMNASLPKGLRLANNEAAGVVVDWAQPRVPRKTGRAAASVKVRSTRTMARVSGGSKSVSYFAWLNYGGRVGRAGSVRRQFIKEGRYLYPGYAKNRDKVRAILLSALVEVAKDAGLEVTHE